MVWGFFYARYKGKNSLTTGTDGIDDAVDAVDAVDRAGV
jgi:hypothetical protein